MSFDPNAHLMLDTGEGEEMRLDRSNSRLYTFLGDRAMYNHVFIAVSEPEDGRQRGTFIFSYNPAFGQIANYMVDNQFPRHLDELEPDESDVVAFNAAIARSATDTDYVPDDWEAA